VSPYSKVHISFLRAIVNEKVKFLIIGGHAAIYHGVNRNTGDLDILVEPTKQNGAAIEPEEFEKPLFLAIGFEPDAVDILTSTAGLDFENVFTNAIDFSYEGVSIKILAINDLIKNKSSLNREGEKALLDKYDAEVLKKILKNKTKE
jgi:hypothetical protein